MNHSGAAIARAATALAAVVGLACGCSGGRDTDVAPGRGVGPATGALPPETPIGPQAGKVPPDPYAVPRRGRERLAPTEVPTTITVERPRTDEAAPPEPPPPRDLSDELRTMMGNPGSCAPATAIENVAPTVSVNVTVSILPGGGVLRASVSAPGLSTSVVQCLEQRAAGLRFRTPVEGAPRTVSATLLLERRAIAPP